MSECHVIEVCRKEGEATPEARRLVEDAQAFLDLRLDHVEVIRRYAIHHPLREEQLKAIVDKAPLHNPVMEYAREEGGDYPEDVWVVDISPKSGVTDNTGAMAELALGDMLRLKFHQGEKVVAGKRYLIDGAVPRELVEKVAYQWLGNELIEEVHIRERASVAAVELEGDHDHLMEVNATRQLALSLEEMKAIQSFYAKDHPERAQHGLPKAPTDVEIECLAQTWSEHCKHKIFQARIAHEGAVVNGVFRSFIRKATEEISQRIGWLVSVFTDNAGIISLTDRYDLAFKVETHNSPSALDPYGGALTGILGVNRDSMGTGIGSRLVANMDVFCLAPPNEEYTLPKRLHHPRRILRGVRHGVEDGGNKSGIPTVNGSFVFDRDYLGKPLVYCGTVGILPKEIEGRKTAEKPLRSGDRIVLVGGRTGKDGIHGATFSSEVLHEASPSSAVQIGDPFTQKKVHDFLLEARDRGLYHTLTDNGAGGLSSSVGEMAEWVGGAVLQLADVPLKYEGLLPWEIFLSESQERMTVAVPSELWDSFAQVAQSHAVEVVQVGEFTDSGYLHLQYGKKSVGLLPLDFLHGGVPQMQLETEWVPHKEVVAHIEERDLGADLMALLARPNICSKEGVIRQYDHEVQASTVVKPLCGVSCDAPADAAVMQPLELHGIEVGFVLGHGICPRYSRFDTYHMTAWAMDEALRNIVALGGDPKHTALLDNYSWPDPIFHPENNPDGKHKLGQLVRSCQALYDYATEWDTPFISGKDSMKNDYHIGETKISVPPTLLVSALARCPDINKTVTSDWKCAGHAIYIVGETKQELGGSEYLSLLGKESEGTVPQVDAKGAKKTFHRMFEAIQQGCVASCHDCSDGGLLVAVAESCFGGAMGANIWLESVMAEDCVDNYARAFGESASRFIVSVPPEREHLFQETLSSVPHAKIGEVVAEPQLTVTDRSRAVCSLPIQDLKESWQSYNELGPYHG